MRIARPWKPRLPSQVVAARRLTTAEMCRTIHCPIRPSIAEYNDRQLFWTERSNVTVSSGPRIDRLAFRIPASNHRKSDCP